MEMIIFEEEMRGLGTAVTPQTYQCAKIAYEDARVNGLCHAGAWECVMAVIEPQSNVLRKGAKL